MVDEDAELPSEAFQTAQLDSFFEVGLSDLFQLNINPLLGIMT
ncbi:hypothetical protein SAMN06265222_105204 [Neorhodopirellula lusitana]|uniref:Uncharacterized protein n=1 Tax=Neorhodopirellula lusitana TaxID=445327 RepID=A0ABY1Q1Z5_9BACT|nr:hypothetical protein SAMN06265222_105204 [Neorhodopirellula lusitana]